MLFKSIVFDTGSGWVGVEYSPEGLTRIILPCDSQTEVLSKISVNNPGIENNEYNSGNDLVHRLKRYFAGEPVDFPDKLDLDGKTPFQKSVWKVTQEIPYGETRSYGWVAGRIKCNSARAVGNALNKNPLPIIIPCHRVINSDGKMGGFGGGLKMKELLLNLEKSDNRSNIFYIQSR